MTSPTILSIVTDVPQNQHRQMDLHDRWLAPYINSRRARMVFRAAEIDTRHSVLATADFLADEPGTEARNAVFMQTARALALPTITKALAQTGLSARDIDHFIVISCTGFDTPGLDVYLAADLEMRPNLRRSALIGMGCHAGLTGLDRAVLEATARPDSTVLILAVEFGTLHFQHGADLDKIVANSIFGDGLAAAIVGPASSTAVQPRIINTMTYSNYHYQELMGFHLSDTGYQIRLSTKVPKVLRTFVPGLVSEFLGQSGLSAEEIKFWGIHPGGAKILDYVGEALALDPDSLSYSRNVLRQYGNMSSVTIFFVLDEIIKQGNPQPDDYALLLTFGPGLTVELCLVKW